jgi:hypothetical protein
MASYGKKIVSGNVEVVWAHLHAPDTAFGGRNHNITVVLTRELEGAIKDSIKASGFGKVSKINGISERDGVRRIKVKNSQQAAKGVMAFPCVDANAKPTRTVPFGGDVVRLMMVPAYLDRDGSVSLYLEGVQIIEKNESNATAGGFSPVEGGFDGSAAEAPTTAGANFGTDPAAEQDDDDLPF